MLRVKGTKNKTQSKEQKTEQVVASALVVWSLKAWLSISDTSWRVFRSLPTGPSQRHQRSFPGAIGRIPITIPPPRLPLEESPDIPHVTESRVERILAKLKPNKASGPDQIRNWLLKEYSDLVAFPVTAILNASFNEQRLPSWGRQPMSLLSQRRNQCSF